MHVRWMSRCQSWVGETKIQKETNFHRKQVGVALGRIGWTKSSGCWMYTPSLRLSLRKSIENVRIYPEYMNIYCVHVVYFDYLIFCQNSFLGSTHSPLCGPARPAQCSLMWLTYKSRSLFKYIINFRCGMAFQHLKFKIFSAVGSRIWTQHSTLRRGKDISPTFTSIYIYTFWVNYIKGILDFFF